MEKMENKICLDSDLLVDFLRNRKEAVDFILSNESKSDLCTTPMNLFELFYGAYKSDKKEENIGLIRALAERINILSFSQESSEKAGEILAQLEKEGKLIEFRDLFIGVIALTNGCAVKTNNKKHFQKIKGLKII
jgi:tRNA(fMet)-specific endonuclease VapC